MGMRTVKPKVLENRYEKPVSPESPKKRWCNITIDLDTMPEAKKWEPGKEYTVTFKLRMTDLSLRKKEEVSNYDDFYGYNNNSKFDIIGVDVKNESTSDGKNKKGAEEDTSDEGDD